MTKKKEEITIFQADDLRAVIMAWVNDSTSSPETYLTKEGMAYLNGFIQSNNTVSLIKKEKFDTLLRDYEDLINKYESLKEESKEKDLRLSKANAAINNLKKKKSWFK